MMPLHDQYDNGLFYYRIKLFNLENYNAPAKYPLIPISRIEMPDHCMTFESMSHKNLTWWQLMEKCEEKNILLETIYVDPAIGIFSLLQIDGKEYILSELSGALQRPSIAGLNVTENIFIIPSCPCTIYLGMRISTPGPSIKFLKPRAKSAGRYEPSRNKRFPYF